MLKFFKEKNKAINEFKAELDAQYEKEGICHIQEHI